MTAVLAATPFAGPTQGLLDVVRLVVATAGLFLAGYQWRLWRDAHGPGQRQLLAALSILLLIVSGSRVQNLGAPITWQFCVTVVATAVVGWGTWQWRRGITAQTSRHRG